MTTQDAGERSADMKRMREEGMGMSVRSYGQLSSTLLKVYLGHRQNWLISSRGNRKDVYNIHKTLFYTGQSHVMWNCRLNKKNKL